MIPSDPAPHQTATRGEILLIGSGRPEHVRLTLDMLHRARSPHVDLIVRPDAYDVLSSDERSRVLFIAGRQKGRLAALRGVRRWAYPTVAVILGGDPGFDALKLAAFFSNGRTFLCCNENGDAFELRHGNLRPTITHVRWRLGLLDTRALAVSILRRASSRALTPIGAVLLAGKTLLLIVKAASQRARLSAPYTEKAL